MALASCGVVETVADHKPCRDEHGHYITPALCAEYAKVTMPEPSAEAGEVESMEGQEEEPRIQTRKLEDRHGLPVGSLMTRDGGRTWTIRDRWNLPQGKIGAAR
jgi:hypothetical protein